MPPGRRLAEVDVSSNRLVGLKAGSAPSDDYNMTTNGTTNGIDIIARKAGRDGSVPVRDATSSHL